VVFQYFFGYIGPEISRDIIVGLRKTIFYGGKTGLSEGVRRIGVGEVNLSLYLLDHKSHDILYSSALLVWVQSQWS
jgi:hypothetical protein